MLFSNLQNSLYFVPGPETYETHACVEFKANTFYRIHFMNERVRRITHTKGDDVVRVWRENASPVEVPLAADMPMDVYEMTLADTI